MSVKKYGLILKKKDEPIRKIQRSQIFDDEGLEDDDSNHSDKEIKPEVKSNIIKGPTLPGQIKQPIGPSSSQILNQDDNDAEDSDDQTNVRKQIFKSSKINRESKLCIQKALEEDPNVFAYDDFYEEIQEKRLKDKEEGQKVKGTAKYVDGLLRSAQLRKIEEQRRIDRKIEKERQAEGEQFDDKETFVTEAYKQKLMERQIFEENERQEQMVEEMTDVTKQSDLSGFYRQMLDQKTGQKSDGASKELLKKLSAQKQMILDTQAQLADEKIMFKKNSEKNLRQRKESISSEDEEFEIKRPVRQDRRKQKEQQMKQMQTDQDAQEKSESDQTSGSSTDHDDDSTDSENKKTDADNRLSEKKSDNDPLEDQMVAEEQPAKPPKPTRKLKEILEELYQKKCVGELFKDQQKKYFERLSSRTTSYW